jgi:hypothetical protein
MKAWIKAYAPWLGMVGVGIVIWVLVLNVIRGYTMGGQPLKSEVLTEVAEAKRDTVVHAYAVTDTVFRTKVLPRYEVVRVTDTVVVDSVVYVNREVADNTVNSCKLALRNCDEVVKADSVVIRQQATTIGQLKRLVDDDNVALFAGAHGSLGWRDTVRLGLQLNAGAEVRLKGPLWGRVEYIRHYTSGLPPGNEVRVGGNAKLSF